MLICVDVELAAIGAGEGALAAAAWSWGAGGAGGGLLPAGTGTALDPLWGLAAGMGGLQAALELPGGCRAQLGHSKHGLGWTDLPSRVSMAPLQR